MNDSGRNLKNTKLSPRTTIHDRHVDRFNNNFLKEEKMIHAERALNVTSNFVIDMGELIIILMNTFPKSAWVNN